jgi:hypothetical protein
MKKITTIVLVAIVMFCIVSTGCISKSEPCTTTTAIAATVANSQHVEQIMITPSSASGTVGYTIQFSAQTKPRTTVVWSIGRGGTGNGVIDSNGVLAPTSAGTIIVVASAGDAVSTALVTAKRDTYRYYDNYDTYYRDNDYRHNYYDDDDRYGNGHHDSVYSEIRTLCNEKNHDHPTPGCDS